MSKNMDPLIITIEGPDHELEAIKHIEQVLRAFSPTKRYRMLDFVSKRLTEESINLACGSLSPRND